MTERPTPEQLRKLLRYEPETGKLFWLPRPESMFSAPRYCKSWNTRHANKEGFTASDNKGYRVGCVFAHRYKAHRVAYALYHGCWPPEEVDHIDGNRADNRISNLRSVSTAINLRNQKRYKTNTSGHTGVDFVKSTGKWRAQIKVNRRTKHLGTFTNTEDAVAARKAAEEGLGFTERHGK
jgi:hypothetical protein